MLLNRGISEMLADIKSRGIAKTNRFGMLIPAPAGMPTPKPISTSAAAIDAKRSEVVDSSIWSQFSIEATQIPGFNVSTTDNYVYHITQKMPYMVNYDEIQMTIRCDQMYSERRFFEAWKDLMKNPHTGDIRYKKDYTVDLFIEQHDDNGNTIFGVVVLNAYPIQVGDLDLQSQSVDFHHMNVSFTYDKYITYDNMDWQEIYEALQFEGGVDYKTYMNDSTARASAKHTAEDYDDADYKNFQKSNTFPPEAPNGATEYKRYQNRGESPMQMLRHAANITNYAKSKVRGIITGMIPGLS